MKGEQLRTGENKSIHLGRLKPEGIIEMPRAVGGERRRVVVGQALRQFRGTDDASHEPGRTVEFIWKSRPCLRPMITLLGCVDEDRPALLCRPPAHFDGLEAVHDQRCPRLLDR